MIRKIGRTASFFGVTTYCLLFSHAFGGVEALPAIDAKVEASSEPSTSQIPIESAKQDGPLIPEDFAKLRDPFRAPESQLPSNEIRSELESYSIEDFRMNAAITGPTRIRAMITAPDGKTFFVSEKMKIGLRNGVIKRITPEKIIVKEKMINAIGQQEYIDSEIRMPPLSKVLAAVKARNALTSKSSGNEPNSSKDSNGADSTQTAPELINKLPAPLATLLPTNSASQGDDGGAPKESELEWLKSAESPSKKDSTEGKE